MSDNGIRYFCPVTSKRLVGPGVSKDVDPENGVDEFTDAATAKPKAAKSEETSQPAAQPKGKKDRE